MRSVVVMTTVLLVGGFCSIDPMLPLAGGVAYSQTSRIARVADPCCELGEVPGIVWYGLDSTMTVEEFAAHCGPILWFSPDEPLLDDARGKDIMIPEAFPFEDSPNAPVVYFRIREGIAYEGAGKEGAAYIEDPNDRSQSIIDFRYTAAVDVDFFFYYSSEEGFGGHQHDVESVQMKVGVGRRDCENCRYGFAVLSVTGKAHGILWYDNTLETDVYTVFPMTILVEEGKHASCTDKNGDGYYTPGYDVNRRTNDAWGVRDVIRSGTLGAGGFQSWMAKVRKPDTRVFPPLPEGNPLRQWYSEEGVYARDYAIYELRPFPRPELAEDDPKLLPFIADKGSPDWPEMVEADEFKKVTDWLDDETFVKSLSIAFRYDGNAGVSFVFPLFIVKNFEDPLAGGWLVNRIYLSDHKLRDISWNILYTTSASRWIDGYFALGAEWDNDGTTTTTYFVTETGIKFRANLGHTAFGFLKKLGTDFWGLRLGVKYKGSGAWNFSSIGYAIEIGAGSW